VFGELPKLFGKSFAIGFFLPATALGLSLLGITAAFGYLGKVLLLLKEKELLGVVSAVVVFWLLAVALMALNGPIYWLLEGYYPWNPFRWRLPDQRREFERLSKAAQEPTNDASHDEVRLSLAERFPDRIEHVLPTKFGNCLRAFEVYSRVIYGIEAIQGWPRLISVIQTEYR